MAQKKKNSATKKRIGTQNTIDPKKALLLALLVALVGGMFVWVSNAGTSSYNKSVADCPKLDYANHPDTQKCIDTSAEALVYRYYAGLLGRQPDKGGIKFWSSQLIKNKQTAERVAERMLASNEAKRKESPNLIFVHMLYVNILGTSTYNHDEYVAYLAKLDAKQVTRDQLIKEFGLKRHLPFDKAKTLMNIDDVQFVTNLYERMLGRKWVVSYGPKMKIQNGEVEYWVNQLKRPQNGTASPKMTRAQVAATFAKSNEAISKHRAGFIAYVNNQK